MAGHVRTHARGITVSVNKKDPGLAQGNSGVDQAASGIIVDMAQVKSILFRGDTAVGLPNNVCLGDKRNGFMYKRKV